MRGLKKNGFFMLEQMATKTLAPANWPNKQAADNQKDIASQHGKR